jgi:hypothetical protein
MGACSFACPRSPASGGWPASRWRAGSPHRPAGKCRGSLVQRTRDRRAREQASQGRVGNQSVPAADDRGEQRPGRERCDVPTTQRHPDRLKPSQARRTRIAGTGDSIQRPGGRADDQIRQHSGLAQRPQHAHLRRGEAAPTLEDQRDTALLPLGSPYWIPGPGVLTSLALVPAPSRSVNLSARRGPCRLGRGRPLRR